MIANETTYIHQSSKSWNCKQLEAIAQPFLWVCYIVLFHLVYKILGSQYIISAVLILKTYQQASYTNIVY